jgi:hypothetical protein
MYIYMYRYMRAAKAYVGHRPTIYKGDSVNKVNLSVVSTQLDN